MDPRHERTEARLRQAVLDLAERTPVEQISVTALARAAGCGRDTVYRHAADAVELLVRTLGTLLTEVMPIPGTGHTIAEGELALLSHVSRYAAIYHGALVEAPSGRVRDLLAGTISRNLTAWLERFPHLPPEPDPDFPPELARRILVAYAASGTVGALRQWLEYGDLDEPEQAARMMLAAAPRWWWESHPGDRNE